MYMYVKGTNLPLDLVICYEAIDMRGLALYDASRTVLCNSSLPKHGPHELHFGKGRGGTHLSKVGCYILFIHNIYPIPHISGDGSHHIPRL